MNRASLLSALATAKASLGPSDGILPVLSHFCFMEGVLYAYDDVTATIVEEEGVEIECALHGETLLGLLAACAVEDVEIILKESHAELDVGTGKVRVPLLPAADFVFDMPEDSSTVPLPISADALKAIELCLYSISTDANKPEFAGVTLRVDKESIVAFSTNNATATRFEILQGKFRKTCAIVLPPQTCSQLLKLAAASSAPEQPVMEVGEKLASVAFAGGVTLVTKFLEARADLFDNVFAGHTADIEPFDLPAGLAQELTKASVLLRKDAVKDCMISVAKGLMTIQTAGELGNMKTTLPITNKKTVGSIRVDPELVLRILPHAEQVAINDSRSLVFLGDGLTHIVAGVTGAQAAKAYKPPAPAEDAPQPQRRALVGRKPKPPLEPDGSEDDDIPY